jgi:hypothetical protein
LGLADEFERRLEMVVEGVFSKAFKSDVEPSEIGRRLLRKMEEGKSVSVGAVYVPNDFTISLSSEDYTRFEGLIPTLRKEFVDLLRLTARERRWRLPGPIDVTFETAPGLKQGKFDVSALHLAGEEPEEPAGSYKLILLAQDGPKEWDLIGEKTSIGRSSANTIVIGDPNTSRNHAEIVRRQQDWWIVDLGSTNGTLVNDVLVKERRLQPGDKIKLGATEFEYRGPSEDGPG